MLLTWPMTVGGPFGPTSFNLPLNDLGNGIVSAVPSQSAGSPTATFTRASVAWTKLASGLWAQVATGQTRSGYFGADTAVSAYGGYFQEGAGTQLVTPTASIRDMTDGSWVAVGITAAKNATGIDGAANSASTLTSTAPNGTILQTLVAAASSRTYSCFMRRKTGVGAILIQQGATTLDVTASLNAVTYTRVQLNASILNSAFGILIATSGDAIEVDFNQFEAQPAGAFASSPMASAGAARVRDALTYPTATNLDGTQGWAYWEAASNNAAATATAFLDSFTAGAGGIPGGTTGGNFALHDGVFRSFGSNAALGPTAMLRMASAWNAAGASLAVNGAQSGTTQVFDGNMNFSANIGIGEEPGANVNLNGFIRNVRFGTSLLTVDQLNAMTA